MASFEIEWKRSAAKELWKLPNDKIPRIVAAVEDIATAHNQSVRASWRAPTTLTGFERVLTESSMKSTPRV